MCCILRGTSRRSSARSGCPCKAGEGRNLRCGPSTTRPPCSPRSRQVEVFRCRRMLAALRSLGSLKGGVGIIKSGKELMIRRDSHCQAALSRCPAGRCKKRGKGEPIAMRTLRAGSALEPADGVIAACEGVARGGVRCAFVDVGAEHTVTREARRTGACGPAAALTTILA